MATKPRLVIGRSIRILLIIFALLGTPHLLRMIFASPALNDLYPVWLGTRELLVHHRNPYSLEMSRRIQASFYGDPLPPGDYEDKECCFAYPVYVSFLLAPSIGSSFPKVSLAALLLLAAATAISVVCWWAVTGHSAGYLTLAIPLVIMSPPIMQGLDLHQLTLLVAALLSGSAVLARYGHFTLAGVALACATMKPQMSILPIAWMLLWSLGHWTDRKKLIVGFAGTMALLLIGLAAWSITRTPRAPVQTVAHVAVPRRRAKPRCSRRDDGRAGGRARAARRDRRP